MIIENIFVIERFKKWYNLLKSMENARMSIGCKFGAIRIQVPPSAPFIKIFYEIFSGSYSQSVTARFLFRAHPSHV